MKIDMEKLGKILYSKKINKFMIYFSILAFILWIALAIYTFLHEGSIWFIIAYMLLATLALFSFDASRKRYKVGK